MSQKSKSQSVKLPRSLRVNAIRDTPSRPAPSGVTVMMDDEFKTAYDRRKAWTGCTDLDKNFAPVQHLIETFLDYASEYLVDFRIPDDAVKQAVRRYLKQKFRAPNFDANRRLSFAEMIRLHIRQKILIGDSLIYKTENGKFQLIHPARITKGNNAPSPVTKDGLVLDALDNITGYAVCSVKNGVSRHVAVLNAEDCIFDAIRKEAQQLRGVSLLLPALNHCRDHMDLLGSTLITARVQAAFGIVIYRDYSKWGAITDSASRQQMQYESDPNAGHPVNYKLSTGGKVELDSGDKMETFESKTPHASFFEFCRDLLRMTYACLQMPYWFYDPANISYTAAKAGVSLFKNSLIKHRRSAQETITQMAEHVLLHGVESGELQLGGMSVEAVLETITLTPLATLILDPTKETTAVIQQIKAGITTLSDSIGEMTGKTFEDTLVQKSYEQKRLTEAGVTVELATPGAVTTTTEGKNINANTEENG